MADDIVTRLRKFECRCELVDDDGKCDSCQAADEIERLRAEVQEVWAVADVLATRLETIASGNTNVLREYDLRREEASRG